MIKVFTNKLKDSQKKEEKKIGTNVHFLVCKCLDFLEFLCMLFILNFRFLKLQKK